MFNIKFGIRKRLFHIFLFVDLLLDYFIEIYIHIILLLLPHHNFSRS